MAIIRLLALLFTIVTLIAVIAYGMAMSRKAKSETDKKFISRYFIILIITFSVGGITREIQQNTGYEWLNGFVPMFGGLFVSLLGIPFFRRISQNKLNGLKAFLLFLPGLLFTMLGLGIIYLGITQIWNALM